MLGASEAQAQKLKDMMDDWEGKSAFACVQMLNAMKHLLEQDNVKCTCDPTPHPNEGDPVHATKCPVWQLGFLVDGWTRLNPPTDAELWNRTVSLIFAMQRTRRDASVLGYTSVAEINFDELLELAKGNPTTITDAYASMEALRATLYRMKAEINLPLNGLSKNKKAKAQGARDALKRFVDEIEEVTDPKATEVCAGLVNMFALWLTAAHPELLSGGEEGTRAIAAAVIEFVDLYHLRLPKKGG